MTTAVILIGLNGIQKKNKEGGMELEGRPAWKTGGK